MNVYMKVALLINLFYINNSEGSSFPDYIKLCNLDDPMLYSCVKENAEAIRPHLAEGIPEMKIPSLEPVHLTRVDLEISRFRVNFSNIAVHHGSTFKMNDIQLKIKGEKADFFMDMFFKKLQLEADYALKGSLLVFVLDAQGPCLANFTDVNTTINIEGHRIHKHNKSYFKFTNTTVKVKPRDLKADLGDVFPSNPELSKHILEVLNEHSIEIFSDFAQVLEEAVQAYISAIIKQVFNVYSLNELFPGSSILNT